MLITRQMWSDIDLDALRREASEAGLDFCRLVAAKMLNVSYIVVTPGECEAVKSTILMNTSKITTKIQNVVREGGSGRDYYQDGDSIAADMVLHRSPSGGEPESTLAAAIARPLHYLPCKMAPGSSAFLRQKSAVEALSSSFPPCHRCDAKTEMWFATGRYCSYFCSIACLQQALNHETSDLFRVEIRLALLARLERDLRMLDALRAGMTTGDLRAAGDRR